jgi:hypothetical protein
VRVDISQRRRDGRWRLIEVKSTTDVRDRHIEDVGIQYRVVRRSGMDLVSGCLAHVNRNYMYPGGDIDVWRFFKIRNLTRRILKLQPKLTSQLLSEFTVLTMPQPPDIAPGHHCTDPVTCEFFDRCNPPRPNDHIGYLPAGRRSKEANFFGSKESPGRSRNSMWCRRKCKISHRSQLHVRQARA